jgi:predicted DNA-binding protein (UPF0251 family)
MPRPFKTRCIAHLPGVTVFKPAGVPARELNRVEIHLDELEALRLVDGEGLDHAQAAERMKVSRPTVGRILERVRKKIAQALVEGEALFIEQGDAPVEHVGEAKRHRQRRRRKTDDAETVKAAGKSA